MRPASTLRNPIGDTGDYQSWYLPGRGRREASSFGAIRWGDFEMDVRTALRVVQARLGWPAPVHLIFELTHLCNLACDYCDRHTRLPSEMSREQILQALAEFRSLGTREISIDGGEPLAHRHVDEIVSTLVDWGITVRMNTNGILVPKRIGTVSKLDKVKISLDGPEPNHDGMRGTGAYRKALRGAAAAREAGVDVEFTCVVGKHNATGIGELLDRVEELGYAIIFQPARNSLFLDTERDGADWQLEQEALRAAFAVIEERKRTSTVVLNRWASLRHFREFPDDVELPCAAGHVSVTMDPEGCLYHCGQVNRMNRSNSVTKLGAAQAFDRLQRRGCKQCWCARVVEENYAWGGRFDRMLPIRKG